MSLFLKLFNTTAEYNTYTADTENFILPNVSLTVDNNAVYFNPYVSTIEIVYKGNGSSATNILLKDLNAYSEVYTLDESSISKMILDGEEITFNDLTVVNYGQYGGTCNEYTYTFNDTNDHTLKIFTNTSEMFRFSPWFKGPLPPSDSHFASITSVKIPNSVTSIGNDTFHNCSGLTSVIIGSGVTSIGNSAFKYCTNLTSIDIPNSVTSIGEQAFYGSSGLTSITIPNTVTSIGNSAFMSCSGLTSVTIGSGAIGGNAFSSCSSLTSITIGNSVTSISDWAFSSCRSLTNITSLANIAPTIQSNTFRDAKSNGTLTVPSGSSGYDVWMGSGQYYLGYYNWTKVEQ